MATRQPLSRDSHAAVGIGSTLYVWGGDDGSGRIKTTALETFDVTSVQWERSQLLNGSSMPDSLWGMAVMGDGETAYCCCGQAGSTWVIPNHFNQSFYMTLSELDETWYVSSTCGFVKPYKVSRLVALWLPS